MRNALLCLVLLTGAVYCEDKAPAQDAKPQKKRTLADLLQDEKDGKWDEPELHADEQIKNIAVRFAVYLAIATTKAQKDEIMRVYETVCDRAMNCAKERDREAKYR